MVEAILQSFSQYYGLDWLAFAAGMTGMYLLTRQSRWGFALSALSAVSGFGVAAMSLQFGYIAYNAILLAMMAKGFHDWGLKSQKI